MRGGSPGHGPVDGDALFPDFDRADWTETAREDRQAEAAGAPAFSFVVLERRRG